MASFFTLKDMMKHIVRSILIPRDFRDAIDLQNDSSNLDPAQRPATNKEDVTRGLCSTVRRRTYERPRRLVSKVIQTVQILASSTILSHSLIDSDRLSISQHGCSVDYIAKIECITGNSIQIDVRSPPDRIMAHVEPRMDNGATHQ